MLKNKNKTCSIPLIRTPYHQLQNGTQISFTTGHYIWGQEYSLTQHKQHVAMRSKSFSDPQTDAPGKEKESVPVWVGEQMKTNDYHWL